MSQLRRLAERAYIVAMARPTSNTGIDAIEDAIQAAMNDRDKEWRAAVVSEEQACCPWCGYRPHLGTGSQSAAYPDCCDHCKPLRALLTPSLASSPLAGEKEEG